MSFTDDVADQEPKCGTCDGSLPCRCTKEVEKPGMSKTGDDLTVTLPVDEAGVERVEAMLRARGYDPDDWEIVSLTVNEWESPRTKDRGIRVLHQTKAHLKRIVPFEDSPAGLFLKQLSFTTGKRRKLKRLAPSAKPGLWVVHGDDQAPFVNWPLHQVFCEFLSDVKPIGLVHLGDGVDFDAISKYRKKPGRFSSTLTEGLQAFHRILSERLEAAECGLTFLKGNHEERLDHVILDRIPALFGLQQVGGLVDVLSVEHLAQFDQLGVEVVRDRKGDYPHATLQIAAGSDGLAPLVATHGWLSRKGAGNTARGSLEHLNASIITGHTHRLAVSHVTRWHPTNEKPVIHYACEGGTMADPAGLGYARYPDWQPGFLTVSVFKDGSYHIDPALWDGDTLRWRDSRWTLSTGGVRS